MPPPPPPSRVSAGALLDLAGLQDLADAAPVLAGIAAGCDLGFRVRLELDQQTDAETRRRLNEKLGEVSPDLEVN